jgi:hypothetical protein
LFGKKILDDLEEEEETADPDTSSGCPFSGLAKGKSAVSIANGENGESQAVEAAKKGSAATSAIPAHASSPN